MRRMLFAGVMLWACAAQATIVEYQTDEQLFARSDAVVVAHIWRVEPMRRGASIFTDYELEVTESLKGELRAGTFTFVRTIGGELADGVGTYVAGAPHPPESATVIVFLTRQENGVFMLTGFTLGHYEMRYDSTLRRYFAHRDLDAIQLSRPTPSPTRDGKVEELVVPADRLATQVLEELRQMKRGR